MNVLEALRLGWQFDNLKVDRELCVPAGPHCRGCGEQVLLGQDPQGRAVERFLIGKTLLVHGCEEFDPVLS